MTKQEMAALMQSVFENEIQQLREDGQQEYAHNDNNAFANFERTAEDLGLSREEVLWVFAMKHRDGIASWIKGHKSQREDVRGRINDLIVYLFLLRGMIEESESCETGVVRVDTSNGPEFVPTTEKQPLPGPLGLGVPSCMIPGGRPIESNPDREIL